MASLAHTATPEEESQTNKRSMKEEGIKEMIKNTKYNTAKTNVRPTWMALIAASLHLTSAGFPTKRSHLSTLFPLFFFFT